MLGLVSTMATGQVRAAPAQGSCLPSETVRVYLATTRPCRSITHIQTGAGPRGGPSCLRPLPPQKLLSPQGPGTGHLGVLGIPAE